MLADFLFVQNDGKKLIDRYLTDPSIIVKGVEIFILVQVTGIYIPKLEVGEFCLQGRNCFYVQCFLEREWKYPHD